MQGFSLKAKSPNTQPVRQNVFEKIDKANGEENENDESSSQKRVVNEISSSSTAGKKSDQNLVIVPEPNKDWFAGKSKRSVYVPERKDALKQEYEQASGHNMSYGLNVIKQEGNSEESGKSENKQSRPSLYASRMSDDQIYAEDIAQRPDQPDIDAYKRVPVETFGAALLRGMGWKGTSDLEDKEVNKTVISLEKKRPAFMGLGAKPVDRPTDKSEKFPKKIDMSYVPLVKRDRSTGEIVPEEKPDARNGRRERSRSPDRYRSNGREERSRHSNYGRNRTSTNDRNSSRSPLDARNSSRTSINDRNSSRTSSNDRNTLFNTQIDHEHDRNKHHRNARPYQRQY